MELKPDWTFWNALDQIEPWEAVLLSLDLDPRALQWQSITLSSKSPPANKVFLEKAYSIVCRLTVFCRNLGYKPIALGQIRGHASKWNWPIPAELANQRNDWPPTKQSEGVRYQKPDQKPELVIGHSASRPLGHDQFENKKDVILTVDQLGYSKDELARLINAAELRERLGISKATFYRWKKEGMLPPPKSPGGSESRTIRWMLRDVVEFILNLT